MSAPTTTIVPFVAPAQVPSSASVHSHKFSNAVTATNLRQFLKQSPLFSEESPLKKDLIFPGYPSFNNFREEDCKVVLTPKQQNHIYAVARNYNIPADSAIPVNNLLFMQIETARQNINTVYFFNCLCKIIKLDNPPKLTGTLFNDVNAISTWMDNNWATIEAITKLDLSSQNITGLPAKMINRFTNLETLILSNNPMNFFPDGVVLPKLKSLFLDGTYIHELPANLKLPNLEKINLKTAYFTYWPHTAKMPALKEVILPRAHLFPEEPRGEKGQIKGPFTWEETMDFIKRNIKHA